MASSRDFTPIVVSYLVCIAAGAALLLWGGLPQPWDAFWADVLATAVIFGFSYAYKNSSFYDAYWSVIPPLLAHWWIFSTPGAASDPRVWLATALTWLWAIRLTANWATHWGGLTHEDWRYPIVRARAGRFGTLVDFLGIHLFPTVQVFLGCLPLYVLIRHAGSPLNWVDALALVVTVGAIAIETIADLQLHAFVRNKSTPGSFINHGLWAWSRHPNYFGELSFWWGLALFGLAVAPSLWLLCLAGAVAMTLMFVFVSVPLMDQRSCERRPAYAAHMQRVSALLPLPPRP